MKHPFNRADIEAACEPFDPTELRMKNTEDILQQAWDSAVERGAVRIVKSHVVKNVSGPLYIIAMPENKVT
jgi:hypothetical protein